MGGKEVLHILKANLGRVCCQAGVPISQLKPEFPLPRFLQPHPGALLASKGSLGLQGLAARASLGQKWAGVFWLLPLFISHSKSWSLHFPSFHLVSYFKKKKKQNTLYKMKTLLMLYVKSNLLYTSR